MNDQAREALGRVIKNYGPSICHTPRSCELFVRQECAAYPEELHVLVAALRHGVTTELFRYEPKDRPWHSFSYELRKQLEKRAGLKDGEGDWAVDTWARALGRHPEAWVDMRPVIPNNLPADKVEISKTTLVSAMTAIVGLGGALGGALGAVLMPAALLITQVSTTLPFMDKPVRHGSAGGMWLIVALILLVIALIGAVGGGVGSALGWLYGKGDSNPWKGFSVAFGATFTTTALTGYFCGIFGWFFGSLLSSFCAARACASRGGYV